MLHHGKKIWLINLEIFSARKIEKSKYSLNFAVISSNLNFDSLVQIAILFMYISHSQLRCQIVKLAQICVTSLEFNEIIDYYLIKQVFRECKILQSPRHYVYK